MTPRLFLLASALTLGTPVAAVSQTLAAHRSGVVDTLHGVEVADPYRWLEDLDSERTRAWAGEQDERARAFTAAFPEAAWIRDRVSRIAAIDRFTAPISAGGRLFYLRFPSSGGPGTTPETVLLVQPADASKAAERVLVDPAAEWPADDVSLTRAIPDPSGRRVAYGTIRAGSRWETIRFRDADSGDDGSDELTGVHAGRSGISWAADGSGVWYERFPIPEAGEEQRARLADEALWFHRLGTPQSQDRPVFALSERPDWGIWHRVTDDGRWLVAGGTDPATQHNTVSVLDLADPAGGFRPLVREPDAVYSVVGNDGALVWLFTDLDAPRGRVIAVNAERADRESWRELVPEMPESISSWILARGVGDKLTVGYLRDALTVIRVFDSSGTFLHELDLPFPGSLWSGFVGRQGDPAAYYVLSGLVEPGSIYRLDTASGRSELVRRPDLPYDPARFATEQVFYEGADGVRVPMFLVRDRESSGPRPVWIYGYGFGAWPAAPWFQPHMVAWLEMGGAWALPNTRGGGEYGEEWHAAGSGVHKQTAIDDYIAATEWLIENGVTTAELMVANGSSAGGAVTGAAIVQRPELYAAAVLDYPVLDMLRYHRFTVAGSWLSEYGTAEDVAEFRALRAYSPLHNLEPGTCYPATFVSPGENDQTTPPFHAYKFIAALQHAQGCDRPVLLRVSWGAGHAAGADLESSVETWSDQLAFLARVLDESAWTPRLGGLQGAR